MSCARAVDYDAAIIGARVAGATLAALLGDAGYEVLLVDRAALPSPTLSTHFFRGGRAGAVLQRLGVLEQVLALGSPPLVREDRFQASDPVPTLGPPQNPGDLGFGLSVRRMHLDDILVRRAVNSGTVDLLAETSACELVGAHGRVVGARLRTPDGDVLARAQCVIGADGRNSFVGRAVGAAVQHTEAAHRGFYYRYVRAWPGPTGQAPDGPEFHHAADERAYVFPSDGGLSCVALSLNLEQFAWLRQAPEARFLSRLATYVGLAERIVAADWVGRLLACGPHPNYMRVPVGPGWALVGDAGMHQDPWSGVGIDQAMVHATLLAEALVAWFTGAAAEPEAMASYHLRRDADALAAYQRTVSLSRDLSQLATAPASVSA